MPRVRRDDDGTNSTEGVWNDGRVSAAGLDCISVVKPTDQPADQPTDPTDLLMSAGARCRRKRAPRNGVVPEDRRRNEPSSTLRPRRRALAVAVAPCAGARHVT
jgi:hypothetical protein